MSTRTVTITLTPQVSQLVKALRKFTRAAIKTQSEVKRMRRRHRIITKQQRRDYIRRNRRPALIHNGRKPR